MHDFVFDRKSPSFGPPIRFAQDLALENKTNEKYMYLPFLPDVATPKRIISYLWNI